MPRQADWLKPLDSKSGVCRFESDPRYVYRILSGYLDVLAQELGGTYCEGIVTLRVPLGDEIVWIEVPSEWVVEQRPPAPIVQG